MHINEVSKRLYPRISRNPNFGPIFPGKKCGLSAGKYGTFPCPRDEIPVPHKVTPRISSGSLIICWYPFILLESSTLTIKPLYLPHKREVPANINPLQPKISIYILHTVFYTFSKVLTKRFCLTTKSSCTYWSFPLFSWPWMFDSGLII